MAARHAIQPVGEPPDVDGDRAGTVLQVGLGEAAVGGSTLLAPADILPRGDARVPTSPAAASSVTRRVTIVQRVLIWYLLPQKTRRSRAHSEIVSIAPIWSAPGREGWGRVAHDGRNDTGQPREGTNPS